MRKKTTFFAISAAIIGTILSVGATGSYQTPLGDYSSEKGRQLAQKYASALDQAVAEIIAVYGKDELRLLTLDESVVGGAGFWKNPAKSGADDRYMGILVMVKTPPFIFGQDRDGHVASVLDRYGKSILSALTKQIETIGTGVDGVVICIIWGNTVTGAPKNIGSEGMALFLAREDVIQYKKFKLTIENLVNRNDLFLFSGPSEIDNLIQFILEA